MARVLITGGAGFLGSVVTRLFLTDGYEVTLLTLRGSPQGRLESVKNHKNLTILFFEDGVDKCFKKPVDFIVHLATCFGRNDDTIAKVVSTNLYLPVLLLEKAIKSGCRGFLNADTFFEKKLGLAPREKSYIYTKKTFLDMARDLLVGSDIKFVNLKIEQLYGPADNDKKFVPTMIHGLFLGQSEINLTKGTQKRDFIYVEDAAKAFLFAAKNIENLGKWEEFGVGTGKSVSIKQAVTHLKELTGSAAALRWGALPLRKNEIMDSKAVLKNNQKINWKAEISWRDGFRETVKFFRKFV